MYFEDAVKVLLRRWYIVLAGLVLTGIAAGTAIYLVPTEYQTQGQMLLLQPADVSSDGVLVNPFLNLPPSLSVMGSLVAANAMSKDTERDLAENGFTSEYSVALAPGTGPLLELSTQDTDPALALATLHELIRRMSIVLDDYQAEKQLPQNLLVEPTQLNVSSQAEALPGSKIRALAVIGAVGIIVTLLGAFSVDRIFMKRRKEKAESAAATSTDEPIGSSREGRSAPAAAANQKSRRARAGSQVLEAIDGPPPVPPAPPRHGRRDPRPNDPKTATPLTATRPGPQPKVSVERNGHPVVDPVERGRTSIRMGLNTPRNGRPRTPVNGSGGEVNGGSR